MYIIFLKIKQNTFIILFSAVFSLIFVSCETQNPAITASTSYNFYKIGDNQAAMGGEYLKNNLTVKVMPRYFLETNSIEPVMRSPWGGLRVHFEVTEGGGTVDNPDMYFISFDSVSVKFKTGTTSVNQTIVAQFYRGNEYLTKLTFSAIAFQPGVWNTVSSFQLGSITDMATDRKHSITYLIVNSRLNIQGSNFYEWSQVESFKDKICRNIEIDNNGTLYVSTFDNELYKSTDQAASFVKCPNPYTESIGYFRLSITRDNKIWTSAYNYPFRFSDDGGNTWKLSNAHFKNHEITDFNQLSNGDILAVDSFTIYKSTDGINWSVLNNMPKYMYKVFVTDENDIIALVQDIGYGVSLFKSSDSGKTFNRVYTINALYMIFPMIHIFSKYNGYYYATIPGGSVVRTKDFSKFEEIFVGIGVNDLSIDKNGVIFSPNIRNTLIYQLNPN